MNVNLELDKDDLIALVKGIDPSYDIMDHPTVKQCGSYTGGFHDKWDWNDHELKKLEPQELLCLYMYCKNSWK